MTQNEPATKPTPQAARQKMTNLDYHYEVAELQRLVGGRIANFYDHGTGGGAFRVKFSADGTANVVVELGTRIHLTKYVPPAPEKQSSFVKFLRSRLENARVVAVRQLSFDRVIEFELYAKGRECRLVFESYGKGNAVLCDKDGVIERAMDSGIGDGAFRKGGVYKAPDNSAKQDPAQATAEFECKGKDAAAMVANAFNVAPFYAKEAITRAGVDSFETPKARNKLADALRSLFTGFSPRVYSDGVFSPIPLTTKHGVEAKEFAWFHEALDEYYGAPEANETTAEAKQSDRKNRLESSLAQQARALEAFKETEANDRAAGEWVYANTELVAELLAAARKKDEKRLKELCEANGLTYELKGAELILNSSA